MFYGQCWKCGERWELGTASTCKCPEESEPYKFTDNSTEVLRLSKGGIWANPDIPADEAAKLVLAAMEWNVNVLVDKAVEAEQEKYKWDVHSCGPTCKRYACVAMREAVEAEREACAQICESEWSNVAERIFGEECAAAIRARSNT